MENLTIYKSKNSETEKYVYRKEGYFYSTVYFFDRIDSSINSCCSSQIGCPESCIFCATGDSKFIRNLTVEELKQQFLGSVSCLNESNLDFKHDLLYIIMEGMGEPTYNLQNISEALKTSIPLLSKHFSKIKFRISTAGNIQAIPKYKELVINNNFDFLEHQFQLSLHSSINEDRELLIPNFGSKYSVEQTVDKFNELSLLLNKPLKLNYLLLNFGNKNNYSKNHLDELISLAKPINARIKLTAYSDIGKNITSPNNTVFEDVKQYLIQNGIETKYRKLVGEDIFAACGMLHYED